MILAFVPEFIEPILAGSKIHTIRRDVTNRAKKGEPLYLHDAVDEKHGGSIQGFDIKQCISTQKIEIKYIKLYAWYITGPHVKVDGQYLTAEQIHTLAINDGFTNIIKFFDWFNTDFTGKIIHWTNKRY
jgi:hypothetical protein